MAYQTGWQVDPNNNNLDANGNSPVVTNPLLSGAFKLSGPNTNMGGGTINADDYLRLYYNPVYGAGGDTSTVERWIQDYAVANPNDPNIGYRGPGSTYGLPATQMTSLTDLQRNNWASNTATSIPSPAQQGPLPPMGTQPGIITKSTAPTINWGGSGTTGTGTPGNPMMTDAQKADWYSGSQMPSGTIKPSAPAGEFSTLKTRDATSTGYNPSESSAFGTTGVGYGASKAGVRDTSATGFTANERSLNADTDTVQGQLNGIMKSGSPLLEAARTRASQSAAERGLSNSSMAVQAGELAMFDAAMPIAQTDAQLYQNQGLTNQAAKNRASEFGASAANRANEFNADASNKNSMFNAESANRAGEFGANATNQANIFSAEAKNKSSLFNADAQNKAGEFTAGAANQASLVNADAANKASLASFDWSNKLAAQGLDIASKEKLANIEASYKQVMQTNASAGQLYGQTMQNITNLMNNTDMDDANKQAGINQQMELLNKGMVMFDKINGLSLASIFNLPGGTVPNTTGTTPTTNAPGTINTTIPGGGFTNGNTPIPQNTSGLTPVGGNVTPGTEGAVPNFVPGTYAYYNDPRSPGYTSA